MAKQCKWKADTNVHSSKSKQSVSWTQFSLVI